MLTIRFQRVGRKNDPAFRVVVSEKRSKPKSGELEILGSYHPKTKQSVLKNDRILYWAQKGAKFSPTVHNLLIAKGVIQDKKINVVKKPKVPSLAGGTAAKTEVSANPSVETPLVAENKPAETAAA